MLFLRNGFRKITVARTDSQAYTAHQGLTAAKKAMIFSWAPVEVPVDSHYVKAQSSQTRIQSTSLHTIDLGLKENVSRKAVRIASFSPVGHVLAFVIGPTMIYEQLSISRTTRHPSSRTGIISYSDILWHPLCSGHALSSITVVLYSNSS